MRKVIFFAAILLICTAGCVSAVTTAAPPAPTTQVVANRTPPDPPPSAPSDLPRPTVPATTATSASSPSPTPTASSTADDTVPFDCARLLPPDRESVPGQGILLLSDYEERDFYFLDVASRELRTVWDGQRDDDADYNASLDRQWVAVALVRRNEDRPSTLAILDAQGRQHAEVPWEEAWFSITDWVDNERLIVSDLPGEDFHSGAVLLNPFTGERHPLRTDFPGQYITYPYLQWEEYQLSLAVYDPSLAYVVFPRVLDGSEGIVLWDSANDSELHSWLIPIDFSLTPVWEPGGKFFVINSPQLTNANPTGGNYATSDELFLLHRSGKMEQLTYLADLYNDVEFSPYRWSPDGSFLAFGVSFDGETYPDLFPDIEVETFHFLALLDMETREVIHTCLPVDSGVPPIWSPDGKQVAFMIYSGRFQSRVLIYDLANHSAVQIADNMRPIGWLGDQE